jgi:hypothetical protein
MTANGWTYRRRNINYTVAVGTCAVDDSNDGTGPHETAGYCVNGTGTTTPSQCATYLGKTGDIAGTGGQTVGDCGIDTNYDGAVDGLVDNSGGACSNCSGADSNPNDYKRIVVLVRWNKGLGSRYALQSTTVPNPGQSAAPALMSLLPVSQNVAPGTQTLTFTATFSWQPAAVVWYVDGTAQGQATGSGTNWSFQWDLGAVSATSTPNADEILDGVYLVSSKGFDTYGQSGTAKASTVNINRRIPYPPSNPHVGRNDGRAYVEWGANGERDVEGYRVYRKTSGSDQLVCGLVARPTRCRENGMPSGDQSYYVVAVDRDSSGNQREGEHSDLVTVPATDTPPNPPPTVVAAKSGQNTVLSWTAASDPDAGDSILFYRIYRDGTDWINDYYDRTSTGSNLSYTDTSTDGDVHTYWVVAVDQEYTESRPLGSGVTK